MFRQERKGFFRNLFSKWWAWALVPVACFALIITASLIGYLITPSSTKEVMDQKSEVQSKLDKSETKLAKVEASLKKTKSSLEDSKAKLDKSKAKLKKVETKAKDNLEATKKAPKEIEDKLAKSEIDLKETKGKLKEANTKVADLKKQLKQANAKVVKAKHEVKTANAKVEDVKEKATDALAKSNDKETTATDKTTEEDVAGEKEELTEPETPMYEWPELSHDKKVKLVKESIDYEVQSQAKNNVKVNVIGSVDEFIKVIDDRYEEIEGLTGGENVRMSMASVASQVAIMGHSTHLLSFN
ncbi:hypothetical protein P2R43_17970 [Priestia megaterium]|nr:hypothetical protein [Priestia megaterium]MDF2062230.1 hypothetical protein [Priestia megaterium]